MQSNGAARVHFTGGFERPGNKWTSMDHKPQPLTVKEAQLNTKHDAALCKRSHKIHPIYFVKNVNTPIHIFPHFYEGEGIKSIK